MTCIYPKALYIETPSGTIQLATLREGRGSQKAINRRYNYIWVFGGFYNAQHLLLHLQSTTSQQLLPFSTPSQGFFVPFSLTKV